MDPHKGLMASPIYTPVHVIITPHLDSQWRITPCKGPGNWIWRWSRPTMWAPRCAARLICFFICPPPLDCIPVPDTCVRKTFNSLVTWRPVLLLTIYMIWGKSGNLSFLISIIRLMMINPSPLFVIRVSRTMHVSGTPSQALLSGGIHVWVDVSSGRTSGLFKTGTQDTHRSEAGLMCHSYLVHLPA